MKKPMILMTIIFSLFSFASIAEDGGAIKLEMVAEQEIVIEDESGEKEIKREPVSKIVPGDHVIYTIKYQNAGEKDAEAVVINNPIPQEMDYIPGSASGKESQITFSVDGGKSYDKPENLTVVKEDGSSRSATAKDYTHVRWEIAKSVEPGVGGEVSYRAELQ